jgi:hypothetical protein
VDNGCAEGAWTGSLERAGRERDKRQHMFEVAIGGGRWGRGRGLPGAGIERANTATGG